MEGQADEKTNKKPSLKNGVPRVVVTTVPTELVVTDRRAAMAPHRQARCCSMSKNTTGNVFKNLNDQQTYVLVTGRWFRAPDLTGPWQYVAGKDLPPDFARIPDDSPKENVKASVPGDDAGPGGGHCRHRSPRRRPSTGNKATFTPRIQRHAGTEADSGYHADVCRQLAVPDHHGFGQRVVCGPERHLVYRQFGPGAVVRGNVDPGGHLLHPALLATPLCHLCEDLRCDTPVRRGRLYTRLHGDDRYQ